MKQINNNSNEYLRITLENGKVNVCAYDGVFGYSATLDDWQDYDRYCDEKANDWVSCPYANYDSYNKEDREKVSKKWFEAKNLREGSYEYYFNLEDLKECFRNEVSELAKCMGITIEANDEDLEKEIIRVSKNEYFDFTDWKSIARHFYELGLKSQKGE